MHGIVYTQILATDFKLQDKFVIGITLHILLFDKFFITFILRSNCGS